MIKNEQIIKEYSNLYTQIPREYLPPFEELQESLKQLNYDSPMHLFNEHARQIVLAAYNKTDFVASHDFQKTLQILINKPNKTAIFNLLSTVALTNSIIKLAQELHPYNLLSLKYTDEELNAFFRYMNNYFIEIVGMREARSEYKQYLKYFIALSSKVNNETKLMYLRVLNSFVRALTQQQINQELIDFISDGLYVRFETDEVIQINNLLANIIGRCLLTIKNDKEDLYTQLIDNINRKNIPIKTNTPCGVQLAKLFNEGNNAEEELY